MSSTATPTTYLITGTTRGIGKGLVASLLLRPNTTIIACVRDPLAPAAQILHNLPRCAEGSSKLIVVKLDSTQDSDAKNVVEEIQTTHSITHLDHVFANAGILPPESLTPASSLDISWIRQSLEINTIAPILLYQATKPLLDRAENPKFVVTTSIIGSNAFAQMAGPVPILAYSMSKAAVNGFISKIHGEAPNITSIALHPGLVETDMLPAIKAFLPEPPISVETSVAGFLKVVDEATRESASGKILQWNGEVLPF